MQPRECNLLHSRAMTIPDSTPPDHAAALEHLRAQGEDWRALIAAVGPCLLRPEPETPPYQALVSAVASQQLHASAARAILARLVALTPDVAFPEAETLSAMPPEVLRACGFSGRKAESIIAIAQAALDGTVPDAETARAMDDEALIERLAALPGVGRWTVEMLLMHALGRPDIMPVDDYGVRVGWRRLKGLPALPRPRDLRTATLSLSPHRSVAAWYLWRVPEPGA